MKINDRARNEDDDEVIKMHPAAETNRRVPANTLKAGEEDDWRETEENGNQDY